MLKYQRKENHNKKPSGHMNPAKVTPTPWGQEIHKKLNNMISSNHSRGYITQHI